MISMTPYSAFMLGAATNTYGTNLANFWVYNPENYKFEDIKRLGITMMYQSAFLMTVHYIKVCASRACVGLLDNSQEEYKPSRSD